MLATGTQGGELTFWDAVLWSDVAAMRKRLCEVAGRSLTPEEWRELVSADSTSRVAPIPHAEAAALVGLNLGGAVHVRFDVALELGACAQPLERADPRVLPRGGP